MNFRDMQKAVHENSVKHGFWDGHVSPHDASSAEERVLRAEGLAKAPRVLLHGGEENRLVPTKLALIHSEVSEALECYRNGEMEETLDDGGCFCEGMDRADGLHAAECKAQLKPTGLPSELADVVIRTMDLAEALGIDLESAIERKHAFNTTRPYKRGGKAI